MCARLCFGLYPEYLGIGWYAISMDLLVATYYIVGIAFEVET